MQRLDIRTKQESELALKEMMTEQRNLGQIVDRLQRRAEAEAAGERGGCFAGLFRFLSKVRPGSRDGQMAVSQTAVELASVVAGDASGVAASASARRVHVHSAIFGLASSKKADPSAKLAEAADAMEQRITQLQTRAAQHRDQAAAAMKQGQKQAALLMLKKAKMLERQAESNQQSLLAVEQQVDMLAQAHMQRTVTAALSASSKGLKKNKKLLKNAEDAVEDASDARDMAEDLGHVMAEFAQNGGAAADMDEDDLLAELNDMVAFDEDNGGGGGASVGSSELSAAETERMGAEGGDEVSLSQSQLAAMALEAKHAEWDAAVAVRESMPAAPKDHAPGSKKKARSEEKAKLLSTAASAC